MEWSAGGYQEGLCFQTLHERRLEAWLCPNPASEGLEVWLCPNPASKGAGGMTLSKPGLRGGWRHSSVETLPQRGWWPGSVAVVLATLVPAPEFSSQHQCEKLGMRQACALSELGCRGPVGLPGLLGERLCSKQTWLEAEAPAPTAACRCTLPVRIKCLLIQTPSALVPLSKLYLDNK